MPLHILNKKHGFSAQEFIKNSACDFQRRTQRRHEFWILTCYVDFNLVEEVVIELRKTIRITDVFLAFNFSEIYKNGPSKTDEALKELTKKLKDIDVNFEWSALMSPNLMHSKSYAVIQRSNEKISDGLVLVTSANFTKPGFIGTNVEIGYSSTTKKDIADFENKYNYLWENLGEEIESAVLEHGSYLLKFAILSSGTFLHKWSGNLSQQIGIRYSLTPLAKERGSIAPELAAVGFEAGDTFTRQVLNLSELPQKEVPRTFITRFTIETFWGRWCPNGAWSALSEAFAGAGRFIENFKAATTDQKLLQIKEEAFVLQNQLISQGLIQPVGRDHLDRWVEKIQDLRNNPHRLERFFSGYETHPLPYSIEQKTEVIELFNNLVEAIELSKATNIAKDKVSKAIELSDLRIIEIDDEELEIINAMQSGV